MTFLIQSSCWWAILLFSFEAIFIYLGSRDSVGIATGYVLDGRGVGVRVPVGARFSPLHVVQTDYGAHPASYLIGTEGSFPVCKAAEA
jgi:hypothetical protein